MNTGPILVIDFVSRLVSSPVVITAPLKSNAFVFFRLTGIADSMATQTMDAPVYAVANLVFKKYLTGEIILQTSRVASDDDTSSSAPAPCFIFALDFSSPGLAAAVADTGTANLLGEISWSQNNPLYPTIGPFFMTTRSQTFPVRYSTSY